MANKSILLRYAENVQRQLSGPFHALPNVTTSYEKGKKEQSRLTSKRNRKKKKTS